MVEEGQFAGATWHAVVDAACDGTKFLGLGFGLLYIQSCHSTAGVQLVE